MPMFTFNFPIREIILSNGESDGYETESFDYNYDYSILKEEILNIFLENYDVSKDVASKIISDLDLWDMLEEEYEDALDDALEERLYNEAYNAWREEKDY